MIKIFLLNIIIALVHLGSYETCGKLYGINIISNGICNNTIAFGVNNGFFKNATTCSPGKDFPATGSFSGGRDFGVKFVKSDIENFRFESKSYRNRFLFFLTGVSPPVRTEV
ncbi:hypothetical protein [Maribellus maritimus]|uniref:hypothetical protein n=1 Tax=Maribellus maritimus TaxID=2870838 RepID=UPI001EEC7605|nr:hypothetical protein [Maribellus maritimus]MCG6190146.1 hypothetical protein [Maribellus maritimus]